jgi:hypothetical protein
MHKPPLALLLLVCAASGCGEPDVPEPEETAGSPAAGATGAKPAEVVPLPDSAFRLEWGTPGVPSTVARGSRFAVGVEVANKGDQTWLGSAHTEPYAAGAVRLGARWLKSGAATPPPQGVGFGAERGELVQPVSPGQSAVLAVVVTAPSEPGAYLLQLDLCQELVCWFEDKGAAALKVPVTVK